MPDPQIVEMAEIVLQALQPRGEAARRRRADKGGRGFRRIAQLFQRDAQTMALLGICSANALPRFFAARQRRRSIFSATVPTGGPASAGFGRRQPQVSNQRGDGRSDWRSGPTGSPRSPSDGRRGAAARRLAGRGSQRERFVETSLPGRASRLEHVEVAGRRERVGKPAQFLGGPVDADAPAAAPQSPTTSRADAGRRPASGGYRPAAGERGGSRCARGGRDRRGRSAERRIAAERRVEPGGPAWTARTPRGLPWAADGRGRG